MATEIGSAGPGTHIQPGPQGAIFTSFQIQAHQVTNPFRHPVDQGVIAAAPALDTEYLLTNAAGTALVRWHYDLSNAIWKARVADHVIPSGTAFADPPLDPVADGVIPSAPTHDVFIVVEHTGGERVFWSYDASAATWKGVQKA